MSEYYSVTQYAEITGKDPGNIRRLLIKGILDGEKIGNQWVIPSNAEYPSDGRVKDGSYRNWRKKTQFDARHPKLSKKLLKMCRMIDEIHKGAIVEVVLYGSYARGEETPESDIDLALISNKRQTEEEYDKMTDVVVDCELDIGVTLSVIQIEESEYAEWKSTLPFYKNVEKEGIVLWKSA